MLCQIHKNGQGLIVLTEMCKSGFRKTRDVLTPDEARDAVELFSRCREAGATALMFDTNEMQADEELFLSCVTARFWTRQNGRTP